MSTHYIEDQLGGVSLVLADDSTAPFVPAHSTPAARVVLWMRDADKGVDSAEIVATGKPGGSFSLPFNPDVDRQLLFGTQTFSASNTPNPPTLDLINWQPFSMVRETDAPTIGLTADVTVDTAQIGITGFTRFARLRRLRVWADAGMTTLLRELLLNSADYAAHELPRDFLLSRTANVLRNEDGTPLLNEDGTPLLAEDNSDALPQMIYVTVAHSGGVSWTPESNVLLITFASGDGTTPGSTGTFDPKPTDRDALGVL